MFLQSSSSSFGFFEPITCGGHQVQKGLKEVVGTFFLGGI